MLALGGCTLPPLVQRSNDPGSHAEFFAQAVTADASAREGLWRSWRVGERTLDTRLRIALLQSIPDHSGYDPAAAMRTLASLLAQEPPADIKAMARIRLAELQSAGQCRDEVQALKMRMAKIADIERELDRTEK